MASEKINALIEEIKVLSVLELAELVHALEDTFGVSAAAAVAGPATGAVAEFPRKTLKLSRLSWKLLALRLKSSNFTLTQNIKSRHPIGCLLFLCLGICIYFI